MTIETVPSTGVAQLPDDEWFGEGSAFDSGDDLAAALFALAGVTHGADPPEAEIAPPPAPVPQVESAFFEVDRPAALDSARRPYASRDRITAPSTPPRSWSVRAPGDALLFGPESRGLPAEVLESLPPEQRLRLPMLPNRRSLNLSNTVAVAVYEGWRQLGFAAPPG
jgi:hypothetical protein